MTGYINTKKSLFTNQAESPFHLPCPACGQADLWLHVTGAKTFSPGRTFNHRFERLVCHSCGVAANGRNWHQLNRKRAKTQRWQGVLATLVPATTAGLLAGLLIASAGKCPPPAPTPTPTHAAAAPHR